MLKMTMQEEIEPIVLVNTSTLISVLDRENGDDEGEFLGLGK